MLEVAAGILIAVAVLFALPPLLLLVARVSPRLAVALAALVGIVILGVAAFLGAILLFVALGAGAIAYLLFQYRRSRLARPSKRGPEPGRAEPFDSANRTDKYVPRPRPPVIDQ